MATKQVSPKHLKIGDKVWHYGALFEIVGAPIESRSHAPQAAHLVTAAGPSDCAYAKGVCVEPSLTHRLGAEWSFQGNHLATQTVEV